MTIRVRHFVPGRLCLLGEHSDWAAEFGRHPGYCLVVGTDQGLSAVAEPADALLIESPVPDALGCPSGRSRRMDCRWNAKALLAAAGDAEEFFRYCAGVAYQMKTVRRVKGGIRLRITRMDLPLKRGVSSSAAVCILVAKAFNAAYDLRLFPHELMELAYQGERVTGSQCGRMDQACIYGRVPVLLTFRKSSAIRVEPVFPGADISMFFVDLGGKKDTVKILSDLRAAYPRSKRLQEALGRRNEEFVRAAYRALSAGEADELGRIMTEAQRVFDASAAPCSPGELASPLLHQVLSLPEIAPHIYGGKGVGSQGDGTAQFVARSPADRRAAIEKIRRALPRMRCFPLTIHRGALSGRAQKGHK